MRVDWRRLARIVGYAALGCLAYAASVVAPPLYALLPWIVRGHPAPWITAALLLLDASARGLARSGKRPRLRAVLGWIDNAASWGLRRGLTIGVATACGLILATWGPNYLTWPWFRDIDAFATLAQSWDAGILPYRDIRAYNFPGHIYLCWILGKAFGWGRTPLFYAVDLLLLLALGLGLITSSRRRGDGPLPGLVAWLAVLALMAGQDILVVAQRDGQAAMLTVLAVLVASTTRGRGGRILSALLMALAFTLRPHPVVFAPAVLSAIDEGARLPGEPPRQALRAVVEWLAAFAVFLAAGFAPVVLAGVVPDWLRGLRVVAYGGPYSTVTLADMLAALWDGLTWGPTSVLLVLFLLVAAIGPDRYRREARTWALLLLGALVYKPLHPVPHNYLGLPLVLTSAMALGLPTRWALASVRIDPTARLVLILFLAYLAAPGVPQNCCPDESALAFGPLLRGEEPPLPPTGCDSDFVRNSPAHRAYRWDDYRAVLGYLRAFTKPTTSVANLLRKFPFPALNGPTGRLSPFRVESGICWNWMIQDDRDADFARDLEHAGDDSVVVWVPDEKPQPRMSLPKVVEVVRRAYQFETRFGTIEVWRRRPATSPAS
jgi:hypothetical protein